MGVGMWLNKGSEIRDSRKLEFNLNACRRDLIEWNKRIFCNFKNKIQEIVTQIYRIGGICSPRASLSVCWRNPQNPKVPHLVTTSDSIPIGRFPLLLLQPNKTTYQSNQANHCSIEVTFPCKTKWREATTSRRHSGWSSSNFSHRITAKQTRQGAHPEHIGRHTTREDVDRHPQHRRWVCWQARKTDCRHTFCLPDQLSPLFSIFF